MKAAKRLEPPRITGRPEYTEELAKLDRVKSALEAATGRLKTLTSRRQSEAIGRYLNRTPNALRGISEDVLDQMAREVVAEGEIIEKLAKRLRIQSTLEIPFTDPYDVETVDAIFQASRFVSLFERAVKLQSRRVIEEKNKAIAEVCNGARPERQRIARAVAASALALIHAVNEENAFLEQLKSQDEALPAMLRPGAFPIALHPESAVCSWLAAALEISEDEVLNLTTNRRLEEKAVQ